MSADGFLNVAVTGVPRVRLLSSGCVPGDRIVLWKPLGTGLALTARNLGIVKEDELAHAFNAMERSNSDAADLLVELEGVAPGSVRAVNDVSGFGFLESLRKLIGTGIAEIDACQLRYFEGSDLFVVEETWSALADANLVASDEYTTYRNLGVPLRRLVPALLNDPQTSGGLLAIIDPATWTLAESQVDLDACDVGTVTAAGGGPRVIIAGQEH